MQQRGVAVGLVGLLLAGCGLAPGLRPEATGPVGAKSLNPLRALVRSEIMAGFASYDANHDGALTRDEVAFLADARFHALDRDGDGRITATEGSPAESELDGVVSMTEKALKGLFQNLDANHDGMLLGSELAMAREIMAPRASEAGVSYDGFVQAIASAPEQPLATLHASKSKKPLLVMVPGWFLPTKIWVPLAKRLAGLGWTEQVTVPHWPGWCDIRDYSAATDFRVKQAFKRTGLTSVDVVGHSMGGLILRYYIKHLGGAAITQHYVSFGTPHHGTAIGHLWPVVSCVQMYPGSDFLNELNADDETPGKVSYTSIRTFPDEIVLTNESPVLEGADNHFVPFAEHLELVWDPRAQKIAIDAMQR